MVLRLSATMALNFKIFVSFTSVTPEGQSCFFGSKLNTLYPICFCTYYKQQGDNEFGCNDFKNIYIYQKVGIHLC